MLFACKIRYSNVKHQVYIFLTETAHLLNLANKKNVHLRKMLSYPSNKASLYQRHFSRALTP